MVESKGSNGLSVVFKNTVLMKWSNLGRRQRPGAAGQDRAGAISGREHVRVAKFVAKAKVVVGGPTS